MKSFPLFTLPAPMVGRSGVFERMVNNLTKATPQHLSLVAPRFFGKSVLLGSLAGTVRSAGTFECVMEWDLGHQTPQSDDEFLAVLRGRIADDLKSTRTDLADYLREDDAGYDELREVIETLGREGKTILMIWDGLDKPLRSGKLTRNLWDNLLELCRQDAFVLVTASRRKLQELIRDEESVTSEFWQVFEVVRLTPMDDADVKAFADAMTDHTFEPGALKEVANWSGGNPPLLVWLLNRISEEVQSGNVTNSDVNTAASNIDEKATDILETIWTDCPATARDLFQLISENSECLFGDAGKKERAFLIEQGLAKQVGNKLQIACRLLVEHIAESAPASGTIGRFFGTSDGYQSNIRSILELRLAHIPRFDEKLFHKVERSIEEIPNFPEDCLNNLTHIEDRALDLIWEKETGDDRCLTQSVVNSWTAIGSHNVRIVKEMMDADRWRIPGERALQLTVLQLLTGSHQTFTKVTATHVSKDTYVLLNAIHSFRNRSQHSDGQKINLGVAISAIMLCIELLGCLSREFAADVSE